MDEMNQKVDIISRQKGTMHQTENNVGETRGHPAQWGRQSRGESSGFGERIYTKGLRLEFPCFNGEDPDSWCYKADQFFEFDDIPEGQRLSLTAFHMEGKALSWFQALRSSNNLSSWSEFLIAIQVRFGKGSYDDPMETLSKLKQTGSLEEYKTQFEVLASRVLRLIDSHKLSMFLGVGLRDDIRGLVRMFNPKTLNNAYALARMQEECIVINKKYGKPVWGSFRNQEVGKEEDRVQKWGKTVTLDYHGQQVGRHQEEIKSPLNEKIEIQEKFKKGAEKCDQTKEIKNTDKLDQEREETENKMMQETNPVEDTHNLFDQMIQPNQKELSLSKSIKVKTVHFFGV
jgi:hypothetical protein